MVEEAAFKYDVFLSHSANDKDVVREIANRLKSDGVRVWFDEWEIHPGDSIPAKIEDGLEHSRVLVLCLSAKALAADWPQLESHTFRFKDPLNHDRRFIPLRLDDAPTTKPLAQFSYIDWRTDAREQEYPKLLEACKPHVEFDGFHEGCLELLTNRASERTLVGGLLDTLESLRNSVSFDRESFRWRVLSTVSLIVDERPGFPQVGHLRSALDECLSVKSCTAHVFGDAISRFRERLAGSLEALAENGATHIDAGDTILLYADSKSVLATINTWLQRHQDEKLDLVFCQCVGKPVANRNPYYHAVKSAHGIEHLNARIFAVRDSAIGTMMSSGRIKKVFLGAHQWGWLSFRRAWFTNTQGTTGILAAADKFGVPVIVLAETNKTQTEPRDAPARNTYDGTPATTKYGIPIEYESPAADEIDSRRLPFVLVTESGEFSCADHGLRKRNRVVVSGDRLSVTKTTIDAASAASEQMTLVALSRVSQSGFRTPSIVASQRSPWHSVSIERKAGIRMYDFVATLNLLARSDRAWESKVETFRSYACEWAIESVRSWQSEEVQRQLTKAFRDPQEAYDFEGKLKEAVEYIATVDGNRAPLETPIVAGIKTLASRVAERASVFLRDSNPKNQILDVVALLGEERPSRCNSIGYFPPVDQQWCDRDIAELLLKRIPQSIPWERVRSQIWQVDFELSSRLTTREDDFIHVWISEVFWSSYDDIVRNVLAHVNNVSEEQIHELVFFRSIRAWARREYYANEEPNTFATRYFHESLAHYHTIAQVAARELRRVLGEPLVGFIEQSRPSRLA